MYDDEVLRRYYEPRPEDGDGIYATHESRASMNLCDKLILTATAMGLAAFFGGATYLTFESVKQRKELCEQQTHYRNQESEGKLDAKVRLDYSQLEKDVLRGR